MPFNSIWTHFRPTELPPLAGPDDLSDCLLKGRQAVPGFTTSHLTETELRDLVCRVYFASLNPDEGRYPQFQVRAYWSSDAQEPFSLLRFAEPLPLSPELLRRLAPAFDHFSNAIRIQAVDGTLRCAGIESTDPGTSLLSPGDTEIWARVGTTAGLRIRADGPGDILASETVTLRLRAGTLADLVPFDTSSHWRPWRQSAAAAILEELASKESDLASPLPEQYALEAMAGYVVGRILERAVAARNGGTLVILPPAGFSRVSLRWRFSSFSLRTILADFWLASLHTRMSLNKATIRSWHQARDRLFHVLRVLGSLTRADGCVVLTPEFDVLGAGGEIVVDDREASTSPLVFSSLKDDEEWPDQSGHDLGGTRHRSAYRLCKVVPNALSLVVSQDGDLTMVRSSADRVHCIRGLTPESRF